MYVLIRKQLQIRVPRNLALGLRKVLLEFILEMIDDGGGVFIMGI